MMIDCVVIVINDDQLINDEVRGGENNEGGSKTRTENPLKIRNIRAVMVRLVG
jgi:hypothetical protein